MVIQNNTKLQWRIVQLNTDLRSISCSLWSSNRGCHQRYIQHKSWMFRILKISNTPKPITPATIKILFQHSQHSCIGGWRSYYYRFSIQSFLLESLPSRWWYCCKLLLEIQYLNTNTIVKAIQLRNCLF